MGYIAVELQRIKMSYGQESSMMRVIKERINIKGEKKLDDDIENTEESKKKQKTTNYFILQQQSTQQITSLITTTVVKLDYACKGFERKNQ